MVYTDNLLNTYFVNSHGTLKSQYFNQLKVENPIVAEHFLGKIVAIDDIGPYILTIIEIVYDKKYAVLGMCCCRHITQLTTMHIIGRHDC